MKKWVFFIAVSGTCLFFDQIVEFDEGSYITPAVLTVYNDDANARFFKKEYATALEKYQTVIKYIRQNQLSDPSNFLQAI